MRLKGQKGFTLMEVLVAVIVMAIAVIPLLDFFVLTRMGIIREGRSREGIALASRKIEQLRAAGYGSAGNDSTIASVNLVAGVHPMNRSIIVSERGDSNPNNDLVGNMTWVVADSAWIHTDDPNDTTFAKIVTVRVAWPRGNPTDSVVVSTLIAR
jgi:prepilin-type N-terminal cleavage/methylation domain-containing protein